MLVDSEQLRLLVLAALRLAAMRLAELQLVELQLVGLRPAEHAGQQQLLLLAVLPLELELVLLAVLLQLPPAVVLSSVQQLALLQVARGQQQQPLQPPLEPALVPELVPEPVPELL